MTIKRIGVIKTAAHQVQPPPRRDQQHFSSTIGSYQAYDLSFVADLNKSREVWF